MLSLITKLIIYTQEAFSDLCENNRGTRQRDQKVETSAGEAGGGTELNANLFWNSIANVFVKLNREQLVSQCRST